jgi:hypothetical protein
VGVSVAAIGAAIMPLTIAGRIKRAANFTAIPAADRIIMGCLAIGSAILRSSLK